MYRKVKTLETETTNQMTKLRILAQFMKNSEEQTEMYKWIQNI